MSTNPKNPFRLSAGAIYGPGLSKSGEYVEPPLVVHRIVEVAFRDGIKAARAKDAELIQRLLDALHIATRYEHYKSFPERWHASIGEWDKAIDAAKAAGFTPSE